MIQINNFPARKRKMRFMKKAGMRWRSLLSAAVMGIAMLVLSAAVSAHPSEHRNRVTTSDTRDAVHPGCMYAGRLPATDYRLHCHFSSAPPLADGAKQSRSHDRASAPATADIALHVFHAVRAPALHRPILGPPSYILFGNFRS